VHPKRRADAGRKSALRGCEGVDGWFADEQSSHTSAIKKKGARLEIVPERHGVSHSWKRCSQGQGRFSTLRGDWRA